MEIVITDRPVRINIAMKDGPLPRSIRRVLSTVGNEEIFTYVEKIDEADLVIFSDVRSIEQGFSKEKRYAFLKISIDNVSLPKNCEIIDTGNVLVGLIKLIESVHKTLPQAVSSETITTVPAAELRADALRVLVIDDMPKHIASAKIGLAGHRLTTVTGYEEAMIVLGTKKFDVVLTDLHLPMSSKTMGSNFKLGEMVPYGILLMVEAARQGAKYVAVVTDLNHHADPFSAAFDHYSVFPVRIENAKVVMMHAPMKDGAKDWATALDWLTKSES